VEEAMEDDKEIVAIGDIARALDKFKEDPEALERILNWASSRYSVRLGFSGQGRQLGSASSGDQEKANVLAEDMAELFGSIKPKTDAERALLAGFWAMEREGGPDFTGQHINSNLKNLGYGVSNITDALSTLIGKKPALVMQTSKSGKSRQARKKYKLTRAGIDYVRAMVREPEEGEAE
jgi:hypothetical protein